MKKSDVLRIAKAKIEDPVHWTKHELALDRIGNPVLPESEPACAWCALGALQFACIKNGISWELYEAVLNNIAHKMIIERDAKSEEFIAYAASVNDMFGHKVVLEMYDRAIAFIEEEENNERDN